MGNAASHRQREKRSLHQLGEFPERDVSLPVAPQITAGSCSLKLPWGATKPNYWVEARSRELTSLSSPRFPDRQA